MIFLLTGIMIGQACGVLISLSTLEKINDISEKHLTAEEYKKIDEEVSLYKYMNDLN